MKQGQVNNQACPRVTAIVNIELYEATMDGNFVLATANESYNAVAGNSRRGTIGCFKESSQKQRLRDYLHKQKFLVIKM